MRTLAAGPDGVLQPGQTVDLPAERAQDMIDGNYADEAVDKPEADATAKPAETATITPTRRATKKS